MAECLFCRIAGKELDSDVVHDSKEVIAFRDINPAGPTHILVIPKRHMSSVKELSASDGDLLTEVFATVVSLAEMEGLSGGYRVVTNVGPDAGQSVPHLHWHLIGGRQMSWPPG